MINKLIWLGLDLETRQAIADDFEMTKTEGSSVIDGRVISDGYSNEMLMKITEEGLKERVGRTQKTLPKDFMKLWEYYVADIRMSLGKEEIKYSNDEKLNETIKVSVEESDEPRTQTAFLKKEMDEVKLNQHKVVSEEAMKIIAKPKKKMGRPKGSKNKK